MIIKSIESVSKCEYKNSNENRKRRKTEVREWEKGREGATEGRVRSITMFWKLYV